MWQPLGVPRVMMTSARGLPKADIIMGFDDIIIDSVNIEQVNGATGSMSRWRVSARFKEKEKGNGQGVGGA